jgi:hypothetical protein
MKMLRSKILPRHTYLLDLPNTLIQDRETALLIHPCQDRECFSTPCPYENVTFQNIAATHIPPRPFWYSDTRSRNNTVHRCHQHQHCYTYTYSTFLIPWYISNRRERLSYCTRATTEWMSFHPPPPHMEMLRSKTLPRYIYLLDIPNTLIQSHETTGSLRPIMLPAHMKMLRSKILGLHIYLLYRNFPSFANTVMLWAVMNVSDLRNSIIKWDYENILGNLLYRMSLCIQLTNRPIHFCMDD